MTGTCDSCRYWQDEERDGVPVERIALPAPSLEVRKVCIWLPIHTPTPPKHRCGQHHPLEDGVDRRPTNWGKA